MPLYYYFITSYAQSLLLFFIRDYPSSASPLNEGLPDITFLFTKDSCVSSATLFHARSKSLCGISLKDRFPFEHIALLRSEILLFESHLWRIMLTRICLAISGVFRLRARIRCSLHPQQTHHWSSMLAGRSTDF